MLPVIYSMSVSLDGFIAGPDGDIGWTAPDAELFRFHIEQPLDLRLTESRTFNSGVVYLRYQRTR
jgi:dihydrofolate reductase